MQQHGKTTHAKSYILTELYHVLYGKWLNSVNKVWRLRPVTVFCIFSPGAVWASLSGDLVCWKIQPARLHNICFLRGVSIKVDINTKPITVCIRRLVNNADTMLGVGALHSSPFMFRSLPPSPQTVMQYASHYSCDVIGWTLKWSKQAIGSLHRDSPETPSSTGFCCVVLRAHTIKECEEIVCRIGDSL